MTTETTDTLQKQVWDVLMRIEKALVQKDATVLQQLLSTDFIGATPTGSSFAKTDYIQHHCNPHSGIVGLSGEDMHSASIRFYDDTAVVNRRVHSQFKLPTGNVVAYDVQRLEVFVKLNQEWKLVSGQGTQVRLPGQQAN